VPLLSLSFLDSLQKKSNHAKLLSPPLSGAPPAAAPDQKKQIEREVTKAVAQKTEFE